MNPLERAKAAFDLIHWNRFRTWFQIGSFLLLVYGAYIGLELGKHLPTFSCVYNTEARGGACYLSVLQHQMAWPWQKLFSAAGWVVLTGFLTFVAWFIVLNKFWCGMICPLGTVQDWITALRRRIGIRPGRYSMGQFKALAQIKYILFALMFLMPLAIGAGWLHKDWELPFCMICPARAVIPTFDLNFIHWTVDFSSTPKLVLTALGIIVVGLFFIGSFVKKRFFCFFCPMSAFLYLISKPALLVLKKDGDKCTKCGDCYNVCDMDIREIADDINNPRIMTDDCTLCLKCIAACPEPGTLKANFAGITFFESTEKGFLRRMNKGAGCDVSKP